MSKKTTSDKYPIVHLKTLPRKGGGVKAGSTKYPFARMKINDSFVFGGSNAANVGNSWGKTQANGYRFCVRTVDGVKHCVRIK